METIDYKIITTNLGNKKLMEFLGWLKKEKITYSTRNGLLYDTFSFVYGLYLDGYLKIVDENQRPIKMKYIKSILKKISSRIMLQSVQKFDTRVIYIDLTSLNKINIIEK